MRFLWLGVAVLVSACTSPNPFQTKTGTSVTCVPGQYLAKPATGSSPAVCGECASGTFSSSNDSASCYAWTNCPAGTYTTTTPSASQDRECESCPGSTYASQPNLLKCLPIDVCPAGTTLRTDASATSDVVCDICGPGNYCPGGDAYEGSCDNETWDDDMNAATPCVPFTQCAAGQYMTYYGDSRHDRTCGDCAVGTFNDDPEADTCAPWTDCLAPDQYVAQDGTSSTDRVCGTCADPTYASTDDSATCDIACRNTIPAVTIVTDTGMQLPLTSDCYEQSCKLTFDASTAHTITVQLAADPKQCIPRSYGYTWTVSFNENVDNGAPICSPGVSGYATDTLSIGADSLPDLSKQSDTLVDLTLAISNNAGSAYDVSFDLGISYENSTLTVDQTQECM